MRLEKKREEEIARRKGLTGRTIFQVIWFVLSFAIAYFFVNYLFDNGYLTESLLYSQLFIPRTVPPLAVRILVMVGVVIVMQIMYYMGFFIASPEGRRRTGSASLHSRNKDPFDDGFSRG